MSYQPTERDVWMVDAIARKVKALMDAEQSPKVSGADAAKLLGLSYAKLKKEHIDEGDLFCIPGTKQFWREDVLKLKAKRELLKGSAPVNFRKVPA